MLVWELESWKREKGFFFVTQRPHIPQVFPDCPVFLADRNYSKIPLTSGFIGDGWGLCHYGPSTPRPSPRRQPPRRRRREGFLPSCRLQAVASATQHWVIACHFGRAGTRAEERTQKEKQKRKNASRKNRGGGRDARETQQGKSRRTRSTREQRRRRKDATGGNASRTGGGGVRPQSRECQKAGVAPSDQRQISTFQSPPPGWYRPETRRVICENTKAGGALSQGRGPGLDFEALWKRGGRLVGLLLHLSALMNAAAHADAGGPDAAVFLSNDGFSVFGGFPGLVFFRFLFFSMFFFRCIKMRETYKSPPVSIRELSRRDYWQKIERKKHEGSRAF
jgi:hypothetical protein